MEKVSCTILNYAGVFLFSQSCAREKKVFFMQTLDNTDDADDDDDGVEWVGKKLF